MRAPSSSSASTNKPTPCCSKVGIKRGPWTPEEDEILANYIKKEGEGRWRTLPKRAGLQRCGKSCRLRWMNYLRPSVKRGQIAPDEEDLILRLHRLLGNRWSLIAGRIPGRTDNEIKNYWNTHLSKKLISQGIDPRTHKPLDPSPVPSVAATLSGNHFAPPNSNFAPASISQQQTYHSSAALEETRVVFSHQQAIPPVQDDLSRIIIHGQDQMPLINQQPDTAIQASNENWQNLDGFTMGLHNNSNAHQSYVTGHNNNNDQDAFSTFLDTLINDAYVTTPYPRSGGPVLPLTPMVSAGAVTYGQGTMWEAAELRSAMESLGEHQQQFNNNSRHL